MSLPIIVIGSLNTDMVVKTQKLPAAGETLMGGIFLMNSGGKGANQAVTAARLGGNVIFVANVGNDIFGKQAIRNIAKENINTNFIGVDKNLPSGVALINVDELGENSIVVAPGANSKLSQKDVENALDTVESPAILLIQLEIPLKTVEYAIRKGHEKGLTIILNPAPVQKLDVKLFEYLDYITPNETEAQSLTGIKVHDEKTARIAARKLLDMGVKNAVITLGAKGAYVMNNIISELITAPLVTAIDATAAGDCFNGALAVALSENRNLKQSISLSSKAASIAVTRMGAQSSIPFKAELNSVVLSNREVN